MLKTMIRLFILLALLLTSTSNFAATCPSADGLDPRHPPAGWELQVPPIFEGQTYYFDEAIHSLNANFYYQQVICKYVACPSPCPAFSLLSTQTFTKPDADYAPWDARSRILNTLTCRPADHSTSRCVFQ